MSSFIESRQPIDEDHSKMENENLVEEVSLQKAVEKFLNSHPVIDSKNINSLKNGLCYEWVNYLDCRIPNCKFSHNPREFYAKKLKRFPSNFIMILLFEMRWDKHFVDLLIEGFEILKKRKVSEKWLAFITFFAFYITNLFDQKFLPFWTNAASYFCELNNSDEQVDGFVVLLEIFCDVDVSKRSKIVDFIKVLKLPPLEMQVSWKLLQPLLGFEIPPQLLIDAVETCNKTKVHVANVLEDIIPQIKISSLPIHGVEILLEFCKTLQESGEEAKCVSLKRRLRPKVASLKIRVDSSYPLTLSYQSESETKDELMEEEELDFNESFKIEDEWTPKYTLNPAFFLSHSALPRNFENRRKRKKEISDSSKKRKQYELAKTSYSSQIRKVLQQLEAYNFGSVGESLNHFSPEDLNRASEEIVLSLLQMVISPVEVVDLVESLISTHKSKNAADIIASISITMIYNFVKVPDWKTAYSILSLCTEKDIDLTSGQIFPSNLREELNEFRKSLLLIEVCLCNEKLNDVHQLLNKHRSFSSCEDEGSEREIKLANNLLNDYFDRLMEKQMTSLFSDSFSELWKNQKRIDGRFDLKKYANDYVLLLLSDGSKDALGHFLEISKEVPLKEFTVRSLLVTLMRQKKMGRAKIILEKYAFQIYNLPPTNNETPKKIAISSNWSEEELLLIFDFFSEKLTRSSPSAVEISIEETETWKNSKIDGLNLCLIDSSESGIESRIRKVLQQNNFPHLILSDTSKVNSKSLMEYLKSRSKNL